MGCHYQFICNQCNYEAVVSGGDDEGRESHTTTISCQECGELFDVEIAPPSFSYEPPYKKPPYELGDELGDELDEPRDETEELVCPRSARAEADGDEDTVGSSPRHVVRRWKFPGPCPKCGEAMTWGDGLKELWD